MLSGIPSEKLLDYIPTALPTTEGAPYTDLHRAGVNLRGLIRIMLFKRFESNVYAFRETLRKPQRIHTDFLKALDEGFVPASEEATASVDEFGFLWIEMPGT